LFAINYKNQNGQVFDFSFQKYKWTDCERGLRESFFFLLFLITEVNTY
jgi:hypothetical protein